MRRSSEKLSERQKTILKFMSSYIELNGYPPTIREIGNASDIKSTSVVNYNLNKLVAAGYLQRSGKVSRGLRMVEKSQTEAKPMRPKKVISTVRVPMYGAIVASAPVPSPDDVVIDEADMVDIAPFMLGNLDPSQVFALRVRGDSMIDALIGDGDIIIMRHCDNTQVRDGDTVAVRLLDRNETTLKQFYREGDRVRLQPRNPQMAPIYVAAGNVLVQGLFVGLMRIR
jgi:repressor LexA